MADDNTPKKTINQKEQQQLHQQHPKHSQQQSNNHHHHHHHHNHQPKSQMDDPQDVQQHHHHNHDHRHHHHHQEPQHNHHHHHHHRHRDEEGGPANKHRTTVLIAMDGSPHSFYAFDWYMGHLHKSSNDVVVVHSSHSNNHLLPSVIDAPSPMMSRMVSKEEEEVNRIAQMIKGKLTATGVRGKMVRLSGDPGPAIVDLANEHRADCIVTGSRGLGTIKRALIGSVSDYVLHHATCPVLVCRYKEKDKDAGNTGNSSGHSHNSNNNSGLERNV